MTAGGMKAKTGRNPADIADLVSSIPALTRGDLIERWTVCHGKAPPKTISTRLLVLAAAYAVQVERHGGLSRRLQKEFLRLSGPPGTLPEPGSNLDVLSVAAKGGRRKQARSQATPRQGARFVREWNGKSHVVEVLDKGFAWQGKTYRSLSAIATSITGSRWSGPRFFGQVS